MTTSPTPKKNPLVEIKIRLGSHVDQIVIGKNVYTKSVGVLTPKLEADRLVKQFPLLQIKSKD